ncbi:Ribonuclease H domain, partial [Arabidopsis thaliana x Arabidopsis arenosa]
AAWREETKSAGFGWVYTNRFSKLDRSESASASNIGSPLMAEAVALFLAQQQALALGFKKLHFASDSQLLIKALTSESPQKELYGILQDILWLSNDFDEISFSFVSREKNSRADALAKSALNSAFIVPASVPVSV